MRISGFGDTHALATRSAAVVLASATGSVLASRQAAATCNVIPGPSSTFRAKVGVIDRPFAKPADWIDLNLDPPHRGNQASPGPIAGDHVVSIIFTPPGAAGRTVVALATDCASLESAREACARGRDGNYQGLCSNGDPCTGLVDQVRFTVDADGNLLVPMDWRGVLVRSDDVPVARLLRGSMCVEAPASRRGAASAKSPSTIASPPCASRPPARASASLPTSSPVVHSSGRRPGTSVHMAIGRSGASSRERGCFLVHRNPVSWYDCCATGARTASSCSISRS